MVSVIPVLGVPRRESETESESGQKATLKSLPPPPPPPLPFGAGELQDRWGELIQAGLRVVGARRRGRSQGSAAEPGPVRTGPSMALELRSRLSRCAAPPHPPPKDGRSCGGLFLN